MLTCDDCGSERSTRLVEYAVITVTFVTRFSRSTFTPAMMFNTVSLNCTIQIKERIESKKQKDNARKTNTKRTVGTMPARSLLNMQVERNWFRPNAQFPNLRLLKVSHLHVQYSHA